MDVNQAIQNQLKNIEKKTGRSLSDLTAFVKESGLQKHGEIRDMLKKELGLGHGDANTLTHAVMKTDAASALQGKTNDDVLAKIYSGPKEALRPIHDTLLSAMGKFGEFEIAPKKGYVSLRRKKQFAMVGPATNTRVDVGINMKDVPATERLVAEKPGGMCQYKVKVLDPNEVDAELLGWIKTAYDAAG